MEKTIGMHDIENTLELTELSILLIEDNPGDARLVQEWLKSIKDFEICLKHTDSLKAANETLCTSHPDIILLDLSLPDSQGLETYQEVAQAVPDIPIIVLTGLKDSPLGLKAVQSGAQDYLTKNDASDSVLQNSILYAIERKKITENQKKSEADLRALINTIVDGVIVLDPSGTILFVNPAAEAMFGKTADELAGQPFGTPEISPGKAVEIELVKPGDASPAVEIRTAQFVWQGQDVQLASLRDVTQHKQLREELTVANTRLKEAVAELEKANQTILQQQKSVIEEERLKLLLQMAGATAHEFSQPMTVLLQSLDLMEADLEDPDQLKEDITLLRDAGIKIRDLVRKMQKMPHYEPKPLDRDSYIVNFDPEIRILSVEDSPEDYNQIKDLLEANTKITLDNARSIADALPILKKGQFDLVLMDHILPDGNSLNFFKSLDENELGIPVVVVTGQGDEMTASQIIQTGAYDYLPKERLSKKSLSRCIMNALEKHRLKQEIRYAMERMSRMATRDELTGLYNHRYFTEALEREVSRAERYQTELILCLMDLDDFKQVNDTGGHPAGDTVLAEFGRLLSQCFRQSDLVCRYGGEEFAVILPSTSCEDAFNVCERFRKMIAAHEFKYKEESFSLTVSTGIACVSPKNIRTPDELTDVCDKALYQAKHAGKNQTSVLFDK